MENINIQEIEMIKQAKPTIFVVEDDIHIAEAIRWLLDSVGLKAELFSSGQAYLDSYDANKLGCLIIDIRMPGMSGLELQDRLGQLNNPIPIIIITGHGDLPLAVQAMRAGALNFITKPFNDQILIDEIYKALAVSYKQTEEVDVTAYQHLYAQLSMRERTVYKMFVEGKTNKLIAQDLNLSLSTIEFHCQQLMRKMKTDSKVELINIYLKLEASSINE